MACLIVMTVWLLIFSNVILAVNILINVMAIIVCNVMCVYNVCAVM